jgi:hypothetical protein
LDRDGYNRLLLEQLHGVSRWENQVAEGWSVKDLDETEIVRTLEEAIRRGRTEDPGTRDPSPPGETDPVALSEMGPPAEAGLPTALREQRRCC